MSRSTIPVALASAGVPAGATAVAVLSPTMVAPGAAAVVDNVAVTDATSAGWVQLGPTAAFVPRASVAVTIGEAGTTRSNAFIVPPSGGLTALTRHSAHVIVDVVGTIT